MKTPLFAHVSPATRKVMQANKGKNTKPEMVVRRLVHGMGYRYRLHRKDLPGKPDLVFGPRRKVIFVHGCFWHGHACPAGSKTITVREGYWTEKRCRNHDRDARAECDLTAAGWGVKVVWECDLRDVEAIAPRLRDFLDGREASPC